MGIPAKLNSIPEGSRTPFRAEAEHHRSDAGFLIVGEVFSFVKRNLGKAFRSEAEVGGRSVGTVADFGIHRAAIGHPLPKSYAEHARTACSAD